MHWALYLLYGFAAAALQSTLMPALIPTSGRPALVLLVVVHLALHVGPRKGMLLCFVLGLLQDTLAGQFLGLHALVFCLTFLSLKSVILRLNTENSFLLLVLVAIACLLQSAYLFVFTTLFSPSDYVFWPLLRDLGWQLFWTTGVGHVMGAAFHALQGRFGPLSWIPGSYRQEAGGEN